MLDESFHSKVLKAASCLNVKEHMVIDASGNAVKLAAPVECKGIVGSDDRHYLLDLMRVTPRDANYDGPRSRFCVLRPELVTLLCQNEATMASDAKSTIKETTLAPDSQHASSDSQNTSSDATSVLENEQPTKADKECTDGFTSNVVESLKSSEILFNPNLFTEFKLGGSEEEIAAVKHV